MKSFAVFLFAVACLAASPCIAQPSRTEVARHANALLESNYEAGAPGAAVLIARGDTVLFRAARGEADVGDHTPLRPDSVFRIGSVTKQFTAAGVLMLVEAGRVNLDDPLSRFLPDFPHGDRITIEQLLNHTSGVRNFNGLPGYMDGPMLQDMTTSDLIGVFRNELLDFEPGSNWKYSNSGYVLLGAVIEAVTGEPWYVYLDRVIFQPLRMTHTGCGCDPRFARQQVHGYTYDDNGALAPLRAMSMTQPHAAGALLSNVDDLLRWNRALHEGRVLRRAEYRRMITPAGQAANEGIGYGFGLFTDSVRGRPMLQHGGHIFGFTSAVSYVPGPDITVIVLENDDADNAPMAADALARRFTAIALGDAYPDPVAIAPDAATLDAAQGAYRFDDGVMRRLRVVDGRLTAQRESGPRTILMPIAADDFLYADGFNRLQIVRNQSGEITAIRFFAHGDGSGVIGTRTDAPTDAGAQALQLPRAALERLAGNYANSELAMTVLVDGDAFKAQIEGQDAFVLLPRSESEFAVEGADAMLQFSAAADAVTIQQGGRRTTLQRTP